MYLALYRKYRPKSFDDVISQPHITTTLKNQIKTGSTAHAYLFTGSRGTGKTTCAKILSMALNCLHPVDGNPCLECEACREIQSGAATDIVEMDAASNNGVDDIRVLRDEVAYTPVSCKYRVYIIDEVHMLSIAAFNALLKTLEEPPAHVVFILATTELHKVPATILSRCQRFEFRRIEIRDSAQRLLEVAKNEGVTLADDAAELISRISDGGMRDALSILDRCISADSNITAELVRACAGVADTRHLFGFSRMIASRDVSGCLKLLDELHKSSKDIARVIDELSIHYRDLMLYKTVPADKELLTALPDEYPEIENISGSYTLDDILRCLTLLQQCADVISKTRQRKTAAEMCFVKMCLGDGSADLNSLVNRSGVRLREPSKPSNTVTAAAPAASAEKTGNRDKAGQTALNTYAPPANKPEREDYPDIPAPVLNSPPAGIESSDIPIPDNPPEEYVPQREFDVSSDKPNSEQSKPTDLPKPVAPVNAPGALNDEQWDAVVSKLPPMYKHMLMIDKAKAVMTDNQALEIHTDNAMLEKQVQTVGYGDIENAVKRALGISVRAVVVLEKPKPAPVTEKSAVEKLLEKAERLKINVSRK